ncbi:TAXI family TRAP transporter solute-binding subunit [Brevibacterium album]|uniref:TAXI family TRAP transporter solute-binding subunit n=1 Tax=Brevibacterium album TaxID=417948 RepID=UPI00146FAE52|nr:TAXI family TRAP transporter solute-binding subunit [Brevibacterium album]
MSRGFRRLRGVAAAVTAGLLLASCGSGEGADGDAGEVVITSYGTSTSSYAEMAAVAEAVMRADGTRFRILPSDTGVGRLQPLIEGAADFARTGDEYWFAFEAMYEYAVPEWGPQQLRIVWTPVSRVGFLARADAGISTAADLAGKRVPQVTANPSADTKVQALLQSAGLSRADTEAVDVSYGDQPDALRSGQIDVMIMSTDASGVAELQSAGEYEWVNLDPADPELEAAFAEWAPAVEFDEFSGAPGQAEGQTGWAMHYPLPVITRADAADEEAYEMTRRIVEAYPDYEGSTAMGPMWAADRVPLVPTVVPFHPGTIGYLEDEGLWSEEAQERQEELLEREEALLAGWEEVSSGVDGEELTRAWEEWRADNL